MERVRARSAGLEVGEVREIHLRVLSSTTTIGFWFGPKMGDRSGAGWWPVADAGGPARCKGVRDREVVSGRVRSGPGPRGPVLSGDVTMGRPPGRVAVGRAERRGDVTKWSK